MTMPFRPNEVDQKAQALQSMRMVASADGALLNGTSLTSWAWSQTEMGKQRCASTSTILTVGAPYRQRELLLFVEAANLAHQSRVRKVC